MKNEASVYEPSFVLFGIDKLTLGMENRYLNFRESPYHLSHIVDIVSNGAWSKLHIQLEINGISNIDFYNPWLSLLNALYICLANGFFKEPLASMLNNTLRGIYFGWLYPKSLIDQYFDTGVFKLDEYELFFDFIGYNPFLGFSKENYKKVKDSRYTLDYKVKTRSDGEKKSLRRSMLCYYNRGAKINSLYSIRRLEFRICGDRAKAILNPMDIFYSVPSFIDVHGEQIKHTLKRYMPSNSIKMDSDYINENAPLLSKLLWLL
jgi:hypothetical protein